MNMNQIIFVIKNHTHVKFINNFKKITWFKFQSRHLSDQNNNKLMRQKIIYLLIVSVTLETLRINHEFNFQSKVKTH
jgi:hypothetical protein